MSVHVTILMQKLDSISHEEFHELYILRILLDRPSSLILRSWSQSHPKIFLGVEIVRTKITKYSQFHVNQAVSEGLRSHGLPVASYDGGVNFWANSVEDLMSVRLPQSRRVLIYLTCYDRSSRMRSTSGL